MGYWLSQAYYEFKDAVTSKGKYIIKAEKEGYDVCYMNCELRSTREDYIKVKEIRMTKIVEHETEGSYSCCFKGENGNERRYHCLQCQCF